MPNMSMQLCANCGKPTNKSFCSVQCQRVYWGNAKPTIAEIQQRMNERATELEIKEIQKQCEIDALQNNHYGIS